MSEPSMFDMGNDDGDLFGDLDLENARDDVFKKPDDWYPMVVTDMDNNGRSKKDDGAKRYFIFKFEITQGAFEGDEIQDWKWMPEKSDFDPNLHDVKEIRKAENAVTYIKQRFLAMGFPAAGMNKIKPDQVIGKEVMAFLESNERGSSIKMGEAWFKLAKAPGIPDAGVAATPFQGSSDGLGVFQPQGT